MSHHSEMQIFLETWERESQGAIRVMESIPPGQYDFRPDPKGRSIGEMAWHLSEIDGCISYGIVERRFDLADDLPELKRPKEVALLAPGYRRVHELALERLRELNPDALNERVTFFDGTPMTIRDILWGAMLHHFVHHRAQLVLLCRQAGGMPPGLYGPNREEMQALKEKMAAKA
jgi:uncharacterized damage-inducible protein DinB